jgi:opacity protein-like surface antigen
MAFANAASKSNFAWALHAGLSYEVTRAFSVELAYRYVNLGSGITGDIVAFDGTNNINNPMHFKDITSHDVKFGLRWMLQQPEVYQPPLMRRG